MTLHHHQFGHSSQRTAHHEAGHAVIAMALEIPVLGVVAVSDSEGHTFLDAQTLKKLSPTHRVLVAAAGLAAESKWCRLTGTTEGSYSIGHFNDEKEATSDLQALGHEGKFLSYVALTERLLSERWEQVGAAAQILKSDRSLTSEQIAHIGSRVRKIEVSELADIALIAHLLDAPGWR